MRDNERPIVGKEPAYLGYNTVITIGSIPINQLSDSVRKSLEERHSYLPSEKALQPRK